MTRILPAAALALLLACGPASAQQLTPVYGWLRTALENTMAQALPPYGKPEQNPSATKETDKPASPAESGEDAANGATKPASRGAP